MMRFLVTGRSGQLARALMERATVSGVLLRFMGRPEFDLASEPKDIADQLVTIGRGFGAQAVIHTGAYTAVDKAESEPAVAMRINGDGAAGVAAAAGRLGVPMLHLSTDYVFDGTKVGAWTEDDPVGPLGVYGRSKLAGEAAARNEVGDLAIFRTAWIYAPYGANFLRSMLRKARDGNGSVRVVSDQYGSPTSALDLADGLIQAAVQLVERPAVNELRGVFHMAASSKTSWAGFAEEIFAISRRIDGPVADVVRVATREYAVAARRPQNSVLSGARLEAAYGISLPRWERALPPVVERVVKDLRHEHERGLES